MSDHSASLLGLIADVQGLLDLVELREGILDALQRVVPSDWASLNDIGSDPAGTVILNRPPLSRRWHEAFAPLANQNPLLRRWLETRDGRAYRFSDLASEQELHRLELFQRVYLPLGVRHQIAFTLPSPAGRVLAVALSRRDRDYSDAERELLDAARPFLIQAYRNALTVAELTLRGEPLALLQTEGLTRRQAEVLQHVARGRSNRDIGEVLGISERTVQKHLEQAFRALGVRGRSEAAARVWALSGERRGP